MTVGEIDIQSGYTYGTALDTSGGGTDWDLTVETDLTVTAGDIELNSSTVDISGDFTINGGDVTGGAPDVTVDGTLSNSSGDVTITGALTLTVDVDMDVDDADFSVGSTTATIGGTLTMASGATLGTPADVTLTGTGDLSLPGQTLNSLSATASGKTTTLISDVASKTVSLGTGTLTSNSPSKALTAGTGASSTKILTNAGATIGSGGGALPTFVLEGEDRCTFDGRSYGSAEITVRTVELTQETAALTCAKLTLSSTTGPVNYDTGGNNVTVNGLLTLGSSGDNEATLGCSSSTFTVANGTSTAVSFGNAISTLKLESSTWTVTGVWDNNVGGNVKGGSSSVTITSASAVDVKPGGTATARFNNLTLSGAGAKTVTQSMWVNGDWTIDCAVTVSAGKGVTFSPGSTTRVKHGDSLTMTGDTSTGTAGFLSGGNEVIVGQGLAALSLATLTLTNVIVRRFATTGIKHQNSRTSSTLTNVTLYANETGLSYASGSTMTVKNCIIWGRAGQTAITGSPTVTYSDVMGGFSGTGNIDSLPRFLDYGDAGLHLGVDSPCIDTGDPASSYSNEPAPNGSQINMGAYGNTAGAQTTQDNTLRAIVAYDEQGNVLASSYGDQTLSLSTYDALSRLTALENGLNETSYFDYDAVGNQTLQLDPQEQATYFGYDTLNRLTSTKAADGGVTSFGYDKVSNRTYAQDPLSNTTYYNYDQLYRVDEIIDPLEVAATYQYDGVGNLIKDTDRVAQVTYFNYDVLYRNTQLAYNAGGNADYTYDAVGNMTHSDDMWGQAYFEYDPINRVTRRQTPEEKVVAWGYEADSAVGAITYPKDVGSALYDHDGRRRIVHAKSPHGGHSYYEYTALDQMASRVFDNGTFTYFEYDSAQRLTDIATAGPTDNALVYFEYGRDTNGDIISMRREDGQTSYYEYDDVRRLTKETIVNSAMAVMYGFEYQFDSAGNRTYLKVTAGDSAEIYYEYDGANAITNRHTLTNAAGRTAGWAYYEYNANGSLTSYKDEIGEETTYTWDENQLCKSIVPPSGSPAYFYYDGRLTRYAMDTGGGSASTTYFSWDGINILQAEGLGPGKFTTTLTHGGTPIAGIGSVVEQVKNQPLIGDTKRYLHNDHRGTTYKITNAAGAEVWSGLTDAYGVELGETGTPDQSIFWYQGQAWYRHEVGDQVLYVSPTRIYCPEDGRFVERDLIERVSADRYGAYFATPASAVDPSGLDGVGVVTVTDSLVIVKLNFNVRAGTTKGVSERDALRDLRRKSAAIKQRLADGVRYMNDARVSHLRREPKFKEINGRWTWCGSSTAPDPCCGKEVYFELGSVKFNYTTTGTSGTDSPQTNYLVIYPTQTIPARSDRKKIRTPGFVRGNNLFAGVKHLGEYYDPFGGGARVLRTLLKVPGSGHSARMPRYLLRNAPLTPWLRARGGGDEDYVDRHHGGGVYEADVRRRLGTFWGHEMFHLLGPRDEYKGSGTSANMLDVEDQKVAQYDPHTGRWIPKKHAPIAQGAMSAHSRGKGVYPRTIEQILNGNRLKWPKKPKGK